eukprot:355950-Chlamydomonas_euryale.AAC.3
MPGGITRTPSLPSPQAVQQGRPPSLQAVQRGCPPCPHTWRYNKDAPLSCQAVQRGRPPCPHTSRYNQDAPLSRQAVQRGRPPCPHTRRYTEDTVPALTPGCTTRMPPLLSHQAVHHTAMLRAPPRCRALKSRAAAATSSATAPLAAASTTTAPSARATARPTAASSAAAAATRRAAASRCKQRPHSPPQHRSVFRLPAPLAHKLLHDLVSGAAAARHREDALHLRGCGCVDHLVGGAGAACHREDVLQLRGVERRCSGCGCVDDLFSGAAAARHCVDALDLPRSLKGGAEPADVWKPLWSCRCRVKVRCKFFACVR